MVCFPIIYTLCAMQRRGQDRWGKNRQRHTAETRRCRSADPGSVQCLYSKCGFWCNRMCMCMKEYVVRNLWTGLVTICSTNLFHWPKKEKTSNLEHHCKHGHVDSWWICEQWIQTCQQTTWLFFFSLTNKTKEEKSSN